MDTTVGVRKLRDELTRYLGRVRRGARVVITDRGQPVALLVPFPKGKRSGYAERLHAVLMSGHVHPAERPFMKQPPLVRGKGKPLSEMIVEDRR